MQLSGLIILNREEPWKGTECLPHHSLPEQDETTIENIDLSLDLYSILSLSERNFSLKFLTSEHNGQRMGEMIMDGELSEHVVKKLEHSIEQQTQVHPISSSKTGIMSRPGISHN